jgi:hypothetical protein
VLSTAVDLGLGSKSTGGALGRKLESKRKSLPFDAFALRVRSSVWDGCVKETLLLRRFHDLGVGGCPSTSTHYK